MSSLSRFIELTALSLKLNEFGCWIWIHWDALLQLSTPRLPIWRWGSSTVLVRFERGNADTCFRRCGLMNEARNSRKTRIQGKSERKSNAIETIGYPVDSLSFDSFVSFASLWKSEGCWCKGGRVLHTADVGQCRWHRRRRIENEMSSWLDVGRWLPSRAAQKAAEPRNLPPNRWSFDSDQQSITRPALLFRTRKSWMQMSAFSWKVDVFKVNATMSRMVWRHTAAQQTAWLASFFLLAHSIREEMRNERLQVDFLQSGCVPFSGRN